MLGSHRGTVQPVAALSAVCRVLGIPLIVDAAQAFAHVDCVDSGADAVYSSSRKWTAGPRGVGFWPRGPGLLTDDALAALADAEVNVAAQLGLSVALGEHVAAGPDRIRARLAEVGAQTRTAWPTSPAGVWWSPSTSQRHHHADPARTASNHWTCGRASSPSMGSHDVRGRSTRTPRDDGPRAAGIASLDVTAEELETLAAAVVAVGS